MSERAFLFAAIVFGVFVPIGFIAAVAVLLFGARRKPTSWRPLRLGFAAVR